jgi:hypothetical protein
MVLACSDTVLLLHSTVQMTHNFCSSLLHVQIFHNAVACFKYNLQPTKQPAGSNQSVFMVSSVICATFLCVSLIDVCYSTSEV